MPSYVLTGVMLVLVAVLVVAATMRRETLLRASGAAIALVALVAAYLEDPRYLVITGVAVVLLLLRFADSGRHDKESS